MKSKESEKSSKYPYFEPLWVQIGSKSTQIWSFWPKIRWGIGEKHIFVAENELLSICGKEKFKQKKNSNFFLKKIAKMAQIWLKMAHFSHFYAKRVTF